ncbi:MAG: hypothetical protein GY803_26250 [Chloroflexi bacterium]|nr:hypothetical protein [Chloroflexota bacterium]
MKRMSVVLMIVFGVAGLMGGLAQIGAAGVGETAVTAAAASSCAGDNLLTNPGFEGTYSAYNMPPPGHPDCQTWNPGEPNQVCERAQMPDGWHPYWRDNPRPETWINIMPEYTQSTPDQVNPDRVRSGEKSLHYFSFYSTHEGGAYQQITAVPGGNYCFSIYGHSWSARTSDDWYSDPDPDNGEMYQKVGIDPTGGTDWQSSNIIWAAEREQYDLFDLFQVEAVAQANTITVFLYSRPNLPVKHNDVYWDAAALMREMTLSVAPTGLGALADDDILQIVTHTVAIDLSPGLTWTASLDPNGAITPTLSAISGNAGENLTVTIDSGGYLTGTYTTTLTIESEAGVLGSPAAIPVTLWVAPELWHVYLPLASRP